MSAPEPMMVVPLAVAEEMRAMRKQIAELTAVVAPLMQEAQWLTISEAAKKYKTSKSTINRWVQEGRLIAKGAGASRRVREKPLD